MKKDKDTGMVYHIDALGRIVLPIELKHNLGIEHGDPIEYFFDDPRIILRKYRTCECTFCSATEQLTYFKDYFICSSCIKEALGSACCYVGRGTKSF